MKQRASIATSIFAGFTSGAAICVLLELIERPKGDWLAFAGSLVGGIAGGAFTLIGAWYAWNGLQEQMTEQREMNQLATYSVRQDILEGILVEYDRYMNAVDLVRTASGIPISKFYHVLSCVYVGISQKIDPTSGEIANFDYKKELIRRFDISNPRLIIELNLAMDELIDPLMKEFRRSVFIGNYKVYSDTTPSIDGDPTFEISNRCYRSFAIFSDIVKNRKKNFEREYKMVVHKREKLIESLSLRELK